MATSQKHPACTIDPGTQVLFVGSVRLWVNPDAPGGVAETPNFATHLLKVDAVLPEGLNPGRVASMKNLRIFLEILNPVTAMFVTHSGRESYLRYIDTGAGWTQSEAPARRLQMHDPVAGVAPGLNQGRTLTAGIAHLGGAHLEFTVRIEAEEVTTSPSSCEVRVTGLATGETHSGFLG